MPDEIKIQVRFKNQDGSFSDALYFTESEYSALSAQQLEALKQQRIDNWQAQKDATDSKPPLKGEELKAFLRSEITRTDMNIEALQAEKKELERRLSESG